MTQILIDILRPNADGELVNVYGEIEFSPSRRHTDGSDIIVGAGFIVKLEGLPVTVTLNPNAADWCWAVVERTQDAHDDTDIYRRYVTVPDSSATIAYADLTDVNPATFEPITAPTSALDAMVVSGSISGDNLVLETFDSNPVTRKIIWAVYGITGLFIIGVMGGLTAAQWIAPEWFIFATGAYTAISPAFASLAVANIDTKK